MSSYSVEVVFTGLCFFCFGGADQACQDFTYVYLVNAYKPQCVCEKDLPGGHKPVLTFDRRHLQYADAHLYDLAPSPDGGQLVVVPLDHLVNGAEGFDLCLREECLDPNGCEPPWPSQPRTADPMGRSRGQNAPKWFKPDANHIDWLPYIPEVEEACRQYPLRDEVTDLDPSYVFGRLRIDWGTLSAHGHARRPRRGLLKPYAVWDSSHMDEDEMPKAFAGAISLMLPELEGALLIQADCSATPRTLFRLRSAPFRTLRLHISNLPTDEIDPLGTTAQDHFRWFYRLYDWDYCPEDVAIPQIVDTSREYAWMEGTMNSGVLCPPGGTKP